MDTKTQEEVPLSGKLAQIILVVITSGFVLTFGVMVAKTIFSICVYMWTMIPLEYCYLVTFLYLVSNSDKLFESFKQIIDIIDKYIA